MKRILIVDDHEAAPSLASDARVARFAWYHIRTQTEKQDAQALELFIHMGMVNASSSAISTRLGIGTVRENVGLLSHLLGV